MNGLRRDRAIEACLDRQTVRALLQHALPGQAAIDDLRIVQARRSASRRRNPNPLTVSYEIDLRDGGDGAAQTRRYYAKVYRDGASAQAARGTPALHLPALDMLLWAWPDDPGLPQLRQLLAPEQTLRLWAAPAATVQALRYEPEQRATLRYRAADGGRSLFAKTFCDDRGRAIDERFRHFWQLAQIDDRAPLVALPLAYDAATRTVWQGQASGLPLRQALATQAGLPLLAERLAHALAALHAAPTALAGSSRHDSRHWLAELERRRTKISRASATLAVRTGRVVDALAGAAARKAAVPLTLIHGDWHADQVAVHGERLVFFDFDEFALGDPLEDLAAFAVRLGADAAPFARLLLQAHARIAPAQHDRQRLQWHLALQHLLQASRAFVFQVGDWRARLQHHLAQAEALCHCATPESLA